MNDKWDDRVMFFTLLLCGGLALAMWLCGGSA